MAKKKRQSALILTYTGWEILQRYRNAFGVKNLLSVGLELFDTLSDKEKIARTSASGAADTAMRRAEAAALKQHKKGHRRPTKEAG